MVVDGNTRAESCVYWDYVRFPTLCNCPRSSAASIAFSGHGSALFARSPKPQNLNRLQYSHFFCRRRGAFGVFMFRLLALGFGDSYLYMSGDAYLHDS